MRSTDSVQKMIRNTDVIPSEQLDEVIHAQISQAEAKSGRHSRVIFGKRKLKYGMIAASVAVIFLFIDSFSNDTGAQVYAAMIEAMKDVRVIHISGWKNSVSATFSTRQDKPIDIGQHHTVDIWEWLTPANEYRKYEMTGPITVWDDGDRCYEYQGHYDRLYIRLSPKPPESLSCRFQYLDSEIQSVTRLGDKLVDLGTRTINGQQAQGYQQRSRSKRNEIWIDQSSHLLLESSKYRLRNAQWCRTAHAVFSYDIEVPKEILSYQVPATDSVHYDSKVDPKYQKWHNRLLDIGQYYQVNPLPNSMELLSRPNDEIWGLLEPVYYPGRIQGVTDQTGYWAIPLFHPLHWFVVRHAPRSLQSSIRVPEDIKTIQMNHDLITKNEDTPTERVHFVLNTLGYDIVTITESRTIWIAAHDGRSLEAWETVKAPVPNPKHAPQRPGMVTGTGEFSLKELFEQFVYYQNYELQADGVLIEDRTQIPSDVVVSSESPFWNDSPISVELARKWFKEEFGVTLTEEKQMKTVYVVQAKTEE